MLNWKRGITLENRVFQEPANIYGIIFGSKHPLGAEKFLSIAWQKNRLNGEADYDIDDDVEKEQGLLFESKRLTKIESFQKRLREKVLNGEIRNNCEAYDFVLDEGHISTHAKDELQKMKKERIIEYDSSFPLVNYDNVYKSKRILDYRVCIKP